MTNPSNGWSMRTASFTLRWWCVPPASTRQGSCTEQGRNVGAGRRRVQVPRRPEPRNRRSINRLEHCGAPRSQVTEVLRVPALPALGKYRPVFALEATPWSTKRDVYGFHFTATFPTPTLRGKQPPRRAICIFLKSQLPFNF